MGQLCSYCTESDYNFGPIDDTIPRSLQQLEKTLTNQHFYIEKLADEQLMKLDDAIQIENQYLQMGMISTNEHDQGVKVQKLLINQARYYRQQVHIFLNNYFYCHCFPLFCLYVCPSRFGISSRK